MSRAICLAHTQIALEKAQALGFLVNSSDSEVCLPRRCLQSSSWASQAFRGSSSKGSGPGESTAQTAPPDSSFSPSAVRGPQLRSRHQSLCGSSPVPPTEGRSYGSGPSQEVLGSPQPGFVPKPRLAVVWEHLQTAGFLASTVDRIALPQRDSTGCLYKMPCGRNFVVGAIEAKQILSQPMCP